MITSQISSLARQCPSCRHALLDACATFAKSPKPPLTSPIPRRRVQNTFVPHRRFTLLSPLRSEVAPQSAIADDEIEEAPLEDPGQPASENEASSSLPWYLRVGTPSPMTSPLADRQRLPELPPDAPPLLRPLLEHISLSLGLDDLSILDLRHLDPPAALGSSLLMILGTARSEKHLHVSADRFCRWLRTEYRLTPYADGLLGRGELKLKVRRKMKRAKALSRVGSAEVGDRDDGLRTGWICVNVGTVEDGEDAAQPDSSIEGYVGFGTGSGGVKIVIQMLTGEKREELDLEKLWRQALARQERREGRIKRGEEAAVEVLEKERGEEGGGVDEMPRGLELPESGNFEAVASSL